MKNDVYHWTYKDGPILFIYNQRNFIDLIKENYKEVDKISTEINSQKNHHKQKHRG